MLLEFPISIVLDDFCVHIVDDLFWLVQDFLAAMATMILAGLWLGA